MTWALYSPCIFLSLFVALWFYSILFHFILFGTESLTIVMTGLELCRPGLPCIHRDPTASTSQVLGLKVYATLAKCFVNF